MTQCGDLFRYVPQIEQTGLPVDPRVMELLVERDRQLEDYLSSLECGEAAEQGETPGIRVDFAIQNIGGGNYITFSRVLAQSGTTVDWGGGDSVTVGETAWYTLNYAVAIDPHVGGDDFSYIEVGTSTRYANDLSVIHLVPETQGKPAYLFGSDVARIDAGQSIRLFVGHGGGVSLNASPVVLQRGLSVVRL